MGQQMHQQDEPKQEFHRSSSISLINTKGRGRRFIARRSAERDGVTTAGRDQTKIVAKV